MLAHLILSATGRENLFPGREDRLVVVQTVVRISARVLLFCAVDDHLHLVVEGERLGHLGGALRRGLARRAPMNPAFLKPVAGRRHLLTLVEYLLRQPAKHDLCAHPALWEGSCFPDLVGARCVGFDTGPIERALPRGHHRDFLTPVGLRTRPVPLDWEGVSALGPARMANAVAAVVGLASLRGPATAQRVSGRRALTWMAHRAGVPTRALAVLLDLDPRSVRRLRHPGEEPPLCMVARTQLHLEVLCGR